MTTEAHDDAVADKLGLTEEQLSEPRGDSLRTEFSDRMAWARTWLKSEGACQAPRGMRTGGGLWVQTDLGRKVDNAELPELVKAWRN